MDSSLRGSLVALHTKAELQASLETTTAYAVEIPLKFASKIVKAVDAAIHHPPPRPVLHHLRRLVRTENLPPHLQNVTCRPKALDCPVGHEPDTACIPETITHNGPFHKHGDDEPQCFREGDQPILHFLICATSMLSLDRLVGVLESVEPSYYSPPYQLRTHTVPVFPPTSDEQAKEWSRSYWPTIYRRNNPFGPHLNIISHAEEEMRDRAGDWMDLARRAGEAVSQSLLGEPIGAVVVDRTSDRSPIVIAAAGDARWGEVIGDLQCGSGNVMGHAVMRAIGFVARKRRDAIEEKAPDETARGFPAITADKLLTAIEVEAYSMSMLPPGGYLCLGLEIYVTHEPCVMCSMAILHSRFARVVFGERLPRTGGISAEAGSEDSGDGQQDQPCLGYGLFWRPELNWKLLAWQWIGDQGCAQMRQLSPNVQA